VTPAEGRPKDCVVDELPFAIWVARIPTGDVVYVNKSYDTVFGNERDAPGCPAFHDRKGNVYAVKDLPFWRVVDSGQAVVVDDLVIHRKDGTRTYLRAFAHPVRLGEARANHVLVAFTDITAEVQAVVARAQVEKHLAVAIHHAPVLLFIMDREGVLAAAEGALLARLERGRRGMVGQSLFETYKNHPTVPDYIRQALAGETVSYSVEVQDLILDVWLGPVRDAAGELAGAIGVCTDVTEARRLQARVIQDDRIRAMGTMAASVAHEINNPLTYVTLGLDSAGLEIQRLKAELQAPELARADGAAAERALAAMERLRDSLGPVLIGTERIRQVTQDLRTFIRRDDERLGPIDVARAVRSSLKLVRKEIEARARLVEEIDATPLVLMNEARLSQVVINLLMNAWQAIPEPDASKHVVGVRTGTLQGWALIEVWDSGPGVRPDCRNEIFEPFVTTKGPGMGTGLGLFVCRNIVSASQGRITVEDAASGGALFRVLLPPTDQPVEIAESETASEKRLDTTGQRPRILIIDDDALVAGALASRVAGDLFEVRTVLDGRQGLDILLTDDRFDLAYCDVIMKDFTGVDLYEALQQQSPERLSKVVFMTGGAFTGRTQVLYEQCRDACVQKPFDIVADARRRVG
jgi:signal transduction histidine kinase